MTIAQPYANLGWVGEGEGDQDRVIGESGDRVIGKAKPYR